MSNNASEVFKKLQHDSQNKVCIDCGVANCSKFFQQYGIDMLKIPIKVKYNTKVAEVYRDKISALSEVCLFFFEFRCNSIENFL